MKGFGKTYEQQYEKEILEGALEGLGPQKKRVKNNNRGGNQERGGGRNLFKKTISWGEVKLSHSLADLFSLGGRGAQKQCMVYRRACRGGCAGHHRLMLLPWRSNEACTGRAVHLTTWGVCLPISSIAWRLLLSSLFPYSVYLSCWSMH